MVGDATFYVPWRSVPQSCAFATTDHEKRRREPRGAPRDRPSNRTRSNHAYIFAPSSPCVAIISNGTWNNCGRHVTRASIATRRAREFVTRRPKRLPRSGWVSGGERRRPMSRRRLAQVSGRRYGVRRCFCKLLFGRIEISMNRRVQDRGAHSDLARCSSTSYLLSSAERSLLGGADEVQTNVRQRPWPLPLPDSLRAQPAHLLRRGVVITEKEGRSSGAFVSATVSLSDARTADARCEFLRLCESMLRVTVEVHARARAGFHTRHLFARAPETTTTSF